MPACEWTRPWPQRQPRRAAKTFRSVMRKGTSYEREDVIHALARYLGFVRVTDTIREPIKSAINSAIRRGLLGYEGSVVWREE